MNVRNHIINNTVEIVIFLFISYLCKDFIKLPVGFIIKSGGKWLVDIFPVIAICTLSFLLVKEKQYKEKLPLGNIVKRKNKFERPIEFFGMFGFLTFWHNSYVIHFSQLVNNDKLFFSGLIGFVILYLLPFIVSKSRKHHNFLAISFVNILLGWTIIGWVFAMTWSVTKPKAVTG